MKENIKKIVGSIGEKSKNVTESTKLKIDVSSTKKQIQDMYIELGKSVCEMHKNDNFESDVIASYSEKIDELKQLIDEKNKEFSEKTSELKDDFLNMGGSAKEFIKDTANDAKDFFEDKKEDLGDAFGSVSKKIIERTENIKESFKKSEVDEAKEALEESAEQELDEAEIEASVEE